MTQIYAIQDDGGISLSRRPFGYATHDNEAVPAQLDSLARFDPRQIGPGLASANYNVAMVTQLP